MQSLLERARLAPVLFAAALGLAVMPAIASAATTTFSYTGAEQSYTVPPGVAALYVTATGAAGGGPTSGTSLVPGRGAVAMGKVDVTPGQTLYVEVGGVGGNPLGGFNGGGNGGDTGYISEYGGGGSSDVRRLSRTATTTLDSRLIVAAGGGGSGYPAAAGGSAGQPGQGFPVAAAGGRAGTQLAGGAGGCTAANIGCGSQGLLGLGGNGGTSGSGADAREGAGGGGGFYGGGGGAGVSGALSGAVGGGGGGSSLLPSNGAEQLATFTQPASVVISTKIPKYTAYEIPVYACFGSDDFAAGAVLASYSYLDKGAGDVHLEGVPLIPAPSAAGWSFTVTFAGVPIGTFTVDALGMVPVIELKGSDVPPANGIPIVNIAIETSPVPGLHGLVVASSTCNPATT
jgi:hypothetical protein